MPNKLFFYKQNIIGILRKARPATDLPGLHKIITVQRNKSAAAM